MTDTGPQNHKDIPIPPDDDLEDDEEVTIVADYNPLFGTDPGQDAPPPQPAADASAQPAPPEPAQATPPPPPAQASPPEPMAIEETSAEGIRRPSLSVGTIINGNYKIMEELKSGGMGRVFRGETIGNELPVAIKTVKADLADDEKYGELFKSESKVLGSLRDEAIVNYNNFQYDAVLNRWFLVMEFIPGEALSDYVGRNGGITVVQAARLFRRLALGLTKAHERGVVHRDLSPDNVMLRNGDLSQAVLIDFGIAKTVVAGSTDNRSSFAGKIKYAAPEQLGLFDGELGPQTDVYGLGLLMAAALTGRPLAMGKNLQSAVDLRREVPDLSSVPVPFRPLLTQMLQPNPTARPDGMHGVISNLPAVEGRTSSGLSTSSLGSEPEMVAPVPGLRRPPRVTRPMGTSMSGTLSSTSQYGNSALTENGTGGGTPEQATVKRKSPLLGILLGLAVLAGAGGAGYFLLSGDGPPTPEDTELATPEATAPQEAAFLASFELGDCTFAALQGEGEAEAGTIALYAATAMATGPLQDGYRQQFGGAVPAITEQTVSPMQCTTLNTARALQATTRDPIRITLETGSGNAVRGAVIDPQERRLWLAAVNRNGQVTPLNNFRGETVGAASSFNVPLNPASKNFPFVVVALATPVPLIETAMVSAGTTADKLFGLLSKEIDEKGIAEQSALRILKLDAP